MTPCTGEDGARDAAHDSDLTMRRAALFFLCSVAPAGAVAACFTSSTPPPKETADVPDAQVDASFPVDAGPDIEPDTSVPAMDSEAEAEVEVDAEVLDVAVPIDSPPDAPPPMGTFTTTAVDFGLVNCGSAAAKPKTYAFTNTGAVPITYSASAGTSSIFAIQGASSGVIAPGATGSIVVTAGVVPATSAAGTALTGTLTITTDVPGSTLIAVPLTVTPQGGSITLSPVSGFGSIELSVQAPDIPLTIRNTGNAAVNVTLGAATNPQFAVAYTGSPGAVALAAGATIPGAAARFKPTAAGLQSATSSITTTGVLCGSPATSIALSGTGTSEAVTAGPTPIDFGTVSCGTQSPQVLPVTIHNGYSFAVNYTTALTPGTPFYSLDAPTGSVPANGTATIHVTPKAIPATASVAAGAFDNTLTINTNAPAGSPMVIALDESAQGAILGLTMASTAFGNVVAGATGTLPFTLTNTGNVDAPITLTPSGAGYGAVFTGTSTATASGGKAAGNATFTPAAAGLVNGSLTFSTSAATCAAVPASVNLSGTGVGPVATYAATPLALEVECGGRASGVGTLTITNNTAYPLSVTASSKNGLFNVTTPTTFAIAANASGSVSIQAPAVASGGGTAGTSADALLFKTNEFGSPTHSVPVTVQVDGANLSFEAPTVDLTTCESMQPITIQNTGTEAATVTQPDGSSAGLYFSGFAGSPTGAPSDSASIAANGGTVSTTVEVDDNCGDSEQTFVYTTSGNVCQGPTLSLPVTWEVPCGGPCC
jgi:hypothetical protein